MVDNQHFLALANYKSLTYGGFAVPSKLYKWNGSLFSPIGSISTQGAKRWSFFSIDGNNYLFVSNSVPNTPSYLYKLF